MYNVVIQSVKQRANILHAIYVFGFRPSSIPSSSSYEPLKHLILVCRPSTKGENRMLAVLLLQNRALIVLCSSRSQEGTHFGKYLSGIQVNSPISSKVSPQENPPVNKEIRIIKDLPKNYHGSYYFTKKKPDYLNLDDRILD